MVSWNQFSLRRRITLQKFISSLQNVDRDALSRRLVELQVNPASFPWHELEQPVETPPAPPTEPEVIAPAVDPPEVSDG